MTSSMRAWRYSSVAGGLEKNLKLETVPKPSEASLTNGQVIVKALAVSLNPADHKVPEMPVVGPRMIPPTISPGMDFSGIVSAVHSSVTNVKVGQKVIGHRHHQVGPNITGVLSEYIVVREKDVTPLLNGISAAEGAGLSTTAMTAYQSLQDVKPGQNVFINGGSGGVGNLGIQIAKILGAKVTTSCSAKNIAFCKELGADEVLDYTASPILEQLKSKAQIFDLVVDNAGYDPSLYKYSNLYLKSKAPYRLIGVGSAKIGLTFASSWATPTLLGGSSNSLKFIMVQHDMDQVKKVAEWVQEGKLKVIIDSEFGYEDAVKAFEKSKTGRAVGKIVIKVADA